ncbi:MAG: A24 family peptidase [Planctomycetaceae bacterium]
MQTLLADPAPELAVAACAVLGLIVGNRLIGPIVRLSEGDPLRAPLACSECGFWLPRIRRVPLFGWIALLGRCPVCGRWLGAWMPLVEIGTAALFAAFAWLLPTAEAHRIAPEISHAPPMVVRLAYYLVLIALLVAATGTDLRRYVVPDAITLPGTVFAITASAAFGGMQLAPLWTEWRAPMGLRALRQEVLPEWIIAHPHWHGFAGAMAGLIAGAGLVWLIRAVSRTLLGYQALGFGDVTLMAMIGAFVGWQPAVLIVLFAPLTGLVAAMVIRLTSHRTMLPYGPWLCLATLIVAGGWRWIWMFELETGPRERLMLREFFADPVLIGIVGGISLVALVVLLGLLRMYKSLPVGRGERRA